MRPMTVRTAENNVGVLLRAWRQQRRLSQMDLALEAEVSTRHVSFIETGRARPSRDLLLHLAEHLEVPLRERNTLLLSAGYAPAYPHTSLDAAEMGPVRTALERILASQEPFPAVVVDRHWDLVAANRPATRIMAEGVAPELLSPPANALRLTLHPRGLASRIVNFGEYSAHLVGRLQRQVAVSGDPKLKALLEELRGYPGVTQSPSPEDIAGRIFVPMVLRAGEGELRFFSTISTFGTALDITVAELAVESFFPADKPTEEALRKAAEAG